MSASAFDLSPQRHVRIAPSNMVFWHSIMDSAHGKDRRCARIALDGPDTHTVGSLFSLVATPMT